MTNLNKHSIFLLALVLLTAVSCHRKPTYTRPTTEFVKEIVADRDNPYNRMLSSVKAGASGEICFIGSELAVQALADVFYNADDKDNIDGIPVGDGLSDFAGETFSLIADTLYYPYERFIEQGKETELRNLAVRYAITAADTVSHINPYDEKGLGIRNRAKIIVFADPYLAQYGLHDADTLLASFGCDIPVISPIDLMYGDILGSGCKNVGVLCQKNYATSGIYSGRFKSMAQDMGIKDSDCIVYPVGEDTDGLLHFFLDKYIASGFSRPLDAIVIDCHRVDINKIRAELVDVISPLSEESALYRKYLSDSFRILESGNTLKEYCYKHLRSTGRFTHKISEPLFNVYYANPGFGAKEGETVLISSDPYVQD